MRQALMDAAKAALISPFCKEERCGIRRQLRAEKRCAKHAQYVENGLNGPRAVARRRRQMEKSA